MTYQERDKWTSEHYFDRINYYLDKSGMNLSTLAKLGGISESALYKGRNGKSIPSTKTILAICDVLEITVQEFYNDNPPAQTRHLKKLLLIIEIVARKTALSVYKIKTGNTDIQTLENELSSLEKQLGREP